MTEVLKDSGLDYIGKIPESWSKTRFKYIKDKKDHYPIGDGDHGSIKPEYYCDEGIPYIRVQNLTWGEKLDMEDIAYIPEHIHNRNKKSELKPGDILVAKTGATIGKTAIIPPSIKKANTTSSVGKITLSDADVCPKYYFYCICSDVCQRQMWEKAEQKSAQPGFNIIDIENFCVPLPSKDEQRLIADFLDEKCAKIDKLSEDIQKQIDLLYNYKRSIVFNAVTKGVNRDMKLQDSGIKWIRKMPETWDTLPIKYLFSIISGSTPESTNPDYWDGDIPWITPADFKTADYYVKGGSRNISKLGYCSCSTNMVPAGSIIFSKRAPIGSVAIAEQPLCTNQGCLSCIRNNGDSTKYYYYVMSVLDDIFNLFGSGTTFKEISATVFENIKLPHPGISEQKTIASFLDDRCSSIDEAIKIKKVQLDNLSTYKNSIIYEYVTGKKRVKGAA